MEIALKRRSLIGRIKRLPTVIKFFWKFSKGVKLAERLRFLYYSVQLLFIK